VGGGGWGRCRLDCDEAMFLVGLWRVGGVKESA